MNKCVGFKILKIIIEHLKLNILRYKINYRFIIRGEK